MIAERLEPKKIIFGLKGDFTEAVDRLCACSDLEGLATKLHAAKPQQQAERYSYIGQGVAVPHVRIDNLPTPELILGLSVQGLKLNDERVHVVLLLATPAEQPAQHLQLLQRTSEGIRVAMDAGTGVVSAVLARPRDGQLNDDRDDRRKNDHRQHCQRAGVVIV